MFINIKKECLLKLFRLFFQVESLILMEIDNNCKINKKNI